MKILGVNKFFYIKGGSETYYFGLKELLEQHGHEMMHFSMSDPRNFETIYSKYFINNIDYNNMNLKDKVVNATKIIYNFDAKKKLEALISDRKPDIAHLHIFQHQLSPSILPVLKKHNIPMVYTAHDLKSVCPNYKMLTNNKVCESCKGKRYYNCLKNKCVKDSRVKTLVNVLEAYVHEFLNSYSLIDKIICPSNFYKNKLIEFGMPENKVIHISNFIDTSKFQPCYEKDDYFIYIGRLSEEKGIETLIKAMNYVSASKLLIVGTGPLEEYLKGLVEEKGIKNVVFAGFKTGKDLEKIIRRSSFMIIPSEWYENGPMSVLECMAYGKAIIGSNIGGIPEFIEDNETGAIFETGNIEDLAKKINYFINNKNEIVNMGKCARKRAESLYSAQKHYSELIKEYTEVINKNKL